ncbi:MAG: hypothetical protein AB1529_05405 [Candidatus Micrarchaeota archaeon]
MRAVIVLAVFALLAVLVFPGVVLAGEKPPPPDGGPAQEEDDTKDEMDVAVNLSCGGNLVTVSDFALDPLEGAHVVVRDVSDASYVAVGDTGSEGTFAFDACGKKVDIKITLSGYSAVLQTMNLVECSECREGSCTSDAQCPADQQCADGYCATLPCECGVADNHACIQYECCSDGDCPETQYCDIPVGAAAGSCRDVSGCGSVLNHTLVPYRCGNAPDCPLCPEGYICINNGCLQGNVTCPATAIVGDQKDCSAMENGEPCVDCDYEVTDPTGKKSAGKTGENGSFLLPLSMAGAYNVTLLSNGTLLKTIQVNVLPGAGMDGADKGSLSFDFMPFVWLLAIIVLAALLVLYWRGRAPEKPKEKA